MQALPLTTEQGDYKIDSPKSVSTLKLKWLHTIAAAFMLLQFAGLLAGGLETKVPQTVNFLQTGPRNGPVGLPELKISYHLGVLTLIALFVGLAGLDHLIVSIIAWCKPELFQYYLDKKTNPLRWMEYSVSASVMSVLLAAMAGIYDVHSLFMIGGLTGICNVCGYLIEKIPRGENQDVAYGIFWTASVALGLSWLPMLCYFFSETDGIPEFVYVAYLMTFLLYCCFALNMYLYYFAGKYDFESAEYYYIILSFTAKTFLAWDVWGGFKASE